MEIKEEKILNNYMKMILLFGFVILAGVLHSCSMDKSGGEVVIEQKTEGTESQGTAEQKETENSGKRKMCVFITGCIQQPGVYELEEGTRLYQLVELAGGFTQEAAEDYLNLAEYVRDGDKITVYSKEEAVSAGTLTEGKTQDEKQVSVNINAADKETLMTLPGIGESKAEAIIRYREENGRFTSAEDIMNISGIKQGAFDKIKDLITV